MGEQNNFSRLKKQFPNQILGELSRAFSRKAAAHVNSQIAPTLQRAKNTYKANLEKVRNNLWSKINVTNPTKENLEGFAWANAEIKKINTRNKKGGRSRRRRTNRRITRRR